MAIDPLYINSFMAEKEGIEPPALLRTPLSRWLDSQFYHFLRWRGEI